MAKLFMVVDIGESIIDTNNIKANIALTNADNDVLATCYNMSVDYLPDKKYVDDNVEGWNDYVGGWNDCLTQIESVNEQCVQKKESINIMKDRYDVPRYINQELFHNILLDIVEDEFDNEYKDIINDTFELRHYDWNAEDWPDEKPNFYHKPSGYKLWWYKYPLRSAEANMKISIKQFADILYDCREAYENRQYPFKTIYNIGNKKWWKKKNKLKNINSHKK